MPYLYFCLTTVWLRQVYLEFTYCLSKINQLCIFLNYFFQLPELINGHEGSNSAKICGIIYNNVGIIIGTLILFLLSVYEEQIKI